MGSGYEIINALHEAEKGGFSLVPGEGRRPASCSNEPSFRRPSSRATDAASTPVVSVEEYREMLADYTSTDQQIFDRLWYLESLCRNIIRDELKNYDETSNIPPEEGN